MKRYCLTGGGEFLFRTIRLQLSGLVKRPKCSCGMNSVQRVRNVVDARLLANLKVSGKIADVFVIVVLGFFR